MKIITGYTGTKNVTANADQGLHQGIFGTGNTVLNVRNKFAATMTDANTVTIQDGEGVMQGVHFRIDPGTSETVSIQSGTAGYKRIDLICARYTKNATTGIEAVDLVVITGTPTTGTPTAPAYMEGDILAGSTQADFPLWQVTLDGLTPTISHVNDVAPSVGIIDIVYPVGSIYMSVNATSPEILFGGKWEAWGAGRVPVGVNTADSDFATVEKIGGEKTHTLTTAEIPSHTHSAVPLAAQRGNIRMYLHANVGFNSGSEAIYSMESGSNDYPTSATGGGDGHNIVQPYITCYMWKRTA